MSALEIGLFQLENLALVQTRFQLFDLRRAPGPVHPHVDALLAKARPLRADQVEKVMQTEQISLDAPIVLLCETGDTSTAVAERLESIGYDQVYVVAGGVAGLLSEL